MYYARVRSVPSAFVLCLAACSGGAHQSGTDANPSEGGPGIDAPSDGVVPADAFPDGPGIDAPSDGVVPADAFPDGPGIDAPSDGVVPADAFPTSGCNPTASPGLVRVWTTGNAAVLSHTPAGALFARTATATSPLYVDIMTPACGSITSVQGNQLYETITNVDPGDELYINAPRVLPSTILGPARVIMDVPVAGATSYRGTTGFGSGNIGTGDPNSFDMYWSNRDVDASGLSTVLVEATTQTGDVLAYAVLEGVSLAGATQNPLHVTVWHAVAPLHHISVSMPPGSVGVSISLASAGHEATYSPTRIYVPGSGSILESDLRYSEFGTAAGVGVGTGLRGQVSIVPAPLPATMTIDIAATLLPAIVMATHDADPARPTMSWTVEPSSNVEDLSIVGIGGIATGNHFAYWRVVVPSGVRSVRLPEMPMDLAVAFSSTEPVRAGLYEDSTLQTYAEARQDPMRFVLNGRNYPLGVVVRSSLLSSSPP